MDVIDTVVIGAGVVGLATAAEIARRGRSVAVLEQHPRPGMETSTHNSGVIHAGIYYPPGTLKAALCVEGVERLYAFCAAHGVPHSRCGKLIVASTPDEEPVLEQLRRTGSANGVKGLEVVDHAFVRRREPHIAATAALWSPATGRVDAARLVHALRVEAERSGAAIVTGAALIGADRDGAVMRLRTAHEEIVASTVVNAAGLYADDVSAMCGGEAFRIYACRGEYATLRPSKRHLVNALVYPVPHASGHGLGVHLTPTEGGDVLLGPTIQYQARKDDYESNRLPLEAFFEPAQRLIPELRPEDLRPGDSGIRAKLHPPQERFADFKIRPDVINPAIVHAAGIDSPGLTSCLAIGARAASIVEEMLR